MPDRTRARLEQETQATGASNVTLLNVHVINGVEWYLSRWGHETLCAEPLNVPKPVIVLTKEAAEAGGIPFNPVAFLEHLDGLNVATWTLPHCESVMEYPGGSAMVAAA